MKKFMGIMLSGMMLAACGGNSSSVQELELSMHGDTLVVASESPIIKQITIDKATFSPYQSTFTTVGTVRAKAGMIAEISLPMDGRTTRSFVQLGQQVSAGQALFAFQASEAADMAKAYQQAQASMNLAKKNLERKQALKANGLVSDREMEEVQHETELAQSELLQWEQTMKVMNMNQSSLKNGGQMSISSPIAGEVVQLEVTPGQFVKADAPALATVANLKQVWISAKLKEYYVNAVQPQDEVTITLNSQNEQKINGKIHYVGQILDPETRSVEVLVECENDKRLLKPGMFAHVEFTTPSTQAILLPSTAVMQGEQFAFVYVQVGKNRFIRRKVEVETASDNQVHVTSGLNEGDQVVTQGAIYLSE